MSAANAIGRGERVGTVSGIRKAMKLRKRMAAESGLAPGEVEMWVETVARAIGAAQAEVLVISDRVLASSARRPAADAEAILWQVGDEFASGQLRHLGSNTPLARTCHPAQAMMIMAQTLERFRPEMHAWLRDHSDEVITRAEDAGHVQASEDDIVREDPFSDDWRTPP